jgi:hypothetical protein
MGRKRKLLCTILLGLWGLMQAFTAIAVGNARVLGNTVFMAKDDAMAVIVCGLAGIILAIVLVIVVDTSRPNFGSKVEA